MFKRIAFLMMGCGAAMASNLVQPVYVVNCAPGGSPQYQGSPAQPVQLTNVCGTLAANTITSSYTVTSTDTLVYADGTSAAVNVVLPAASNLQPLTVIRKDCGANLVQVLAASGDTLIGGATFYRLDAQGQTLATLGIGNNTVLKTYEQPTPAVFGYTFPTTTSVAPAVSSDVYYSEAYTPVPIRLTGIRYSVGTTATTNVDFGVYSSTGGFIRAVGSGAAPGNGITTSSLSSAVCLQPGLYKLAYQPSNTNVQLSVLQTAANGLNPLCYKNTASTMGLINTPQLTLPGTTGTRCYALYGIITGGAP